MTARTEYQERYLVDAFVAGLDGDPKPWMRMFNTQRPWNNMIHDGHRLDWAYDYGKEVREKGTDAQPPAMPDGEVDAEVGHPDYVYQHLPEDLQKYWDELQKIKNSPRQVERFMASKGEGFRKAVFIYVTSQSFDVSSGMKAACISLPVLKRWNKEDRQFSQIYDEILFHKGNFIENALLRRIEDGDTQAIIFASKTLNKERGYGDTMKIEHSHTHESYTTGIDISKLDLTPEEMAWLVNKWTTYKAMQAAEQEALETRSEIKRLES